MSDLEETEYPLIISIYCNELYIIEHPLCTLTHGFNLLSLYIFSHFTGMLAYVVQGSSKKVTCICIKSNTLLFMPFQCFFNPDNFNIVAKHYRYLPVARICLFFPA